MIKLKTTALASVAVASMLVFGASSASAVQIDGEISFATSGWTPTGGATIATATGVNFTSNNTTSTLCSGDFIGLCPGVGGTIDDFVFNPFGGPYIDFWTVSNLIAPDPDFSFDLTSINIDLQNSTSLVLSGSGTMKGVGFDDTPGTWVFTGQTTGGATFSASFTSGATPVRVPEASMLGMFGLGLVGLGVTMRRRKTA